NNVSVINDTNDTVVATVEVGANPLGLGYDAGTQQIFVANEGSSNVSVINDTSNQVVATIAVGLGPYTAVYDPGRQEVFVMNAGDSTVSVISDVSESVTQVIGGVGLSPTTAAYDPGTGELFVTNNGGPGNSTVGVISDATNAVVAEIPVGNAPFGATFDPRTGEVFVSNSGYDTVSVISGSIGRVVDTLAMPGVPGVAAYDSRTGQMFLPISNSTSNDVIVLTETNGTAPFTVIPALEFLTPSGSADVGQTVTVKGSGYGDAIPLQDATLDSIAMQCVGAKIGTCSGGALIPTTVGSFSAQYTIPSGPTSGSYALTLTDSAGNSASAEAAIFEDPTVGIPAASPPSIDLGQSTSFSSSVSLGTGSYHYSWTGLPSGCSENLASTSCIPAAPGRYSVQVTVTDSNGFSVNSGTLSFQVFPDPTLSTVTPSRASVDLGQSVFFSAAYGFGSGNYRFSWSGLPEGCNGESVDPINCTPTGNGSSVVRVQVTDTENESVTNGSLGFTVYSDPTVNIQESVTAAGATADVSLNAMAGLGSGGYMYDWVGLPALCGEAGSAVYCPVVSAGSYSIRVWVIDSNGISVLSAPLPLNVGLPLVANLTATSDDPTTSQTVAFTAAATGGTGGVTYAWVFGDGTRGTGQTVDHSFGSPGTYTITVWVNDSSGRSAMKSMNLVVSTSGTVFGVGTAELATVFLAALVLLVAAAVIVWNQGRKSRPGSPQ
ncbi:MAG: PKD domain-containing protein, partial [Thermoplasmata archaeon]|nr:PKD domain-containing protein [Thermoplasmata archaeon]